MNPSMSASTVSFRRVSKAFGEVDVLVDFDLEVHAGEFLVLLGESGSGKSTALRILAGLETASSGAVFIGGRDVTLVAPKDRDVAMVFQSYALYPHMSVRHNIGYPLKVRGLGKPEIEKAVRHAAAQVQMEDLLDRLPKALSGGQRQRVALARALVRQPSVCLMDEPLSNLDAKLRARMRTELKQVQQSLGLTTLYVTHDQVEAMTLAHRVALLDQGVLQQLDTPERIYNEPANLFVAGFVGSPPMNLMAGALVDGEFRHAAFRLPLPCCAGTGDSVLGLRPEDCELAQGRAVPAGHCSFPAAIFAVELMGDHRLVTLQVGKDTVCVRADKHFNATGNTTVMFAPERAHVFDARTGQRRSSRLRLPTRSICTQTGLA